MSKKNKPKKQKIRLYFRDGKTDVIPQKYWDDYESTAVCSWSRRTVPGSLFTRWI